MRDAKDPDEFLKKFGADRFKLLLEESSNRVEYQLNAIFKKYDLRDDDQKVKYLQESAELISSLGSSVQREVYAGRVAEAAKISLEAMKLEVSRAYKRRLAREKKKQEQIDLNPARNLQPKTKGFHYDNLKSAMAEEGILSRALREPALLDQCRQLRPEQFSCPQLGKAYGQLKDRHEQGLEVSLAGLSDFTSEEMAHLAMIAQRQDGPVNEQAFQDCVRIILAEHQSSSVETESDMREYWEKMKQRKGYKG